MGFFKSLGNAVKSVATVAVAPIAAPVAAAVNIVKGENVIESVKNATLQTAAALNPVGGAEAAISGFKGSSWSPTGTGAVAMGATDSRTQNRFLITNAAAAATGGAYAYFSAPTALATGVGSSAAAAGATAATPGVISTLGTAAVAGAAKGIEGLGSEAVGGIMGMFGGGAAPSSIGNPTEGAVAPISPLVYGGLALGAGYLIFRKGKRK